MPLGSAVDTGYGLVLVVGAPALLALAGALGWYFRRKR